MTTLLIIDEKNKVYINFINSFLFALMQFLRKFRKALFKTLSV